jgi:hypothetical protein
MFQHCVGGPLVQVYNDIAPFGEDAVAHKLVGVPEHTVMSAPAFTVGKGSTLMVS